MTLNFAQPMYLGHRFIQFVGVTWLFCIAYITFFIPAHGSLSTFSYWSLIIGLWGLSPTLFFGSVWIAQQDDTPQWIRWTTVLSLVWVMLGIAIMYVDIFTR